MPVIIFIFIVGESLRRCLGGENETVRWDVPDFSSCTSIEFRDLHEKVRQVLSFSYFRYFRELADGRESRVSSTRREITTFN